TALRRLDRQLDARLRRELAGERRILLHEPHLLGQVAGLRLERVHAGISARPAVRRPRPAIAARREERRRLILAAPRLHIVLGRDLAQVRLEDAPVRLAVVYDLRTPDLEQRFDRLP